MSSLWQKDVGNTVKKKKKLKKTNEERFYVYLGYRCHPAIMQKDCTFRMTAFESRIERYLLDEIEDIVARKNAEVIKARNDAHRVSKYDITALQQELDCLNYSWQEGRIKSVEEYDKRYDELMEQIEAAQKRRSCHP